MTIGEVSKIIWKEFIYGGHLQSLGTISIILFSAILLNIKISLDILLISYLSFYPIYLFDRYKGINIDYITNPHRTEYLKNYINQTPLILFFVIFVLFLSLIYFSNFYGSVFVLSLLTLGLLYSLFFKRITEKILLFKDFYVSSFFAVLVFFPVIYYSLPLSIGLLISLLLLFMFVFLKGIMMQIFLDIKDIESDKQERLLTLAVVLGKNKTIDLLKIFSILSIFPILILAVYFSNFSKPILMLLFTVPFDFYCFNLAKRDNYYGYLLMSGIFISWPILILIGKAIWSF